MNLPNNKLDPKNYIWQTIGNRVVCRDRHTVEMLFNCPIPQTMRQALLLAFNLGKEQSDAANNHHIERLEAIIDQFKPESVPMTEEDYYEYLESYSGEELYDLTLKDVIDDLDALAKEELAEDIIARQKSVEDSWKKTS